MREWLDDRSTTQQRRWWTTAGDEWEVITAAPHFNAAFHTLRLFAGGISGRQGGRGKDTRTAFPRRCSHCGPGLSSLHGLHPARSKQALDGVRTACPRGCATAMDGRTSLDLSMTPSGDRLARPTQPKEAGPIALQIGHQLRAALDAAPYVDWENSRPSTSSPGALPSRTLGQIL